MEVREYHALREVEDTHWWFRSLNEHVVQCLRNSLPPAGALRVLDAGCGTGGLAVRMRELGEVEGVDGSELAVRYCHERGLSAVRHADLNTWKPPVERFDAVTSIDVLYHEGIEDESAVLSNLAAGLRPGGVLLLHLPAYEWLRSRHDRMVHTRRRYRLSEAVELLRGAGLRVEHASYQVTLLFPLIVLVRALGALLRRTPGEASDVRHVPGALNRVLLLVSRLENSVSRRVRLPFGVSVYAIARKPA